MIGRIIGTYKILEPLGEGGVGMVYKGVDTMLDREVAIKAMRPELASQTAVVERFRSEAITLAKLNHPNIATLFSLFRDGDELFMVLEFVEGETLEDILQRRGPLPATEAAAIFCQALDGINYAHHLGIVHRDIKPSNMMIDAAGQLKVLDFGIARLLGSSRMTRVGNIIGTLEYMSPEQIRGEETDARSDIYGLGIMLYEILTGRLPFESENEFVLMKSHTEEIPMLPRQINPDISEAMETAIMKAVEKDPEKRFQDGGEFLDSIYAMNLEAQDGKSLKRTSSRAKPLPLTKVQSKDFPVDLTETAEVAINIPVEEIKTTRLGAIPEPEIQKTEAKETRLGVASLPIPEPQSLKATRLGTSQQLDSLGSYGSQPTNSPLAAFLAKLNWMHYVGAAAAIVILFGVTALAIVMPFLFGGSGEPEKPVGSNSASLKDGTSVSPTVAPTINPTPFEEIAADVDPTPIPEPSDDSVAPPPTGSSKGKTPPTSKKTDGKKSVKTGSGGGKKAGTKSGGTKQGPKSGGTTKEDARSDLTRN